VLSLGVLVCIPTISALISGTLCGTLLVVVFILLGFNLEKKLPSLAIAAMPVIISMIIARFRGERVMRDRAAVLHALQLETLRASKQSSICSKIVSAIVPLELLMIGTGRSKSIGGLADDLHARTHPFVVIVSADMVNFTGLAREHPGLFVLINQLYAKFDMAMGKIGLSKITTIGDCYICGSGFSNDISQTESMTRVTKMIIEMERILAESASVGNIPVRFRYGVSAGPVVSGLIGKTRFVYDVIGTAMRCSDAICVGNAGSVLFDEIIFSQSHQQSDLMSRICDGSTQGTAEKEHLSVLYRAMTCESLATLI
jgi:class 3 adenylate cyclase